MSPLFLLLQINDYAATIVGFGLTLTLLVMILTEKNGELRTVSVVLLQNCVLDLICTVACFLAFPQNYIHNGVHYLMVTGFLRDFPDRNLGTFLIWFYIVALSASVYVIPIPFFMRYLIICKGAKSTVKPMIMSYLVVFILTAITAIATINAYPMDTEHNNALARPIESTFWVQEYGKVPIFAAGYVHTWKIRTSYIWGGVSISMCYNVILYLVLQMQKEIKLKTQMVSMSKLNLQVQKVLILQAIGPFITAVIPISILSFMVLFNLEQDMVLLSVATLFVWVAGFNAAAALFIVKAYRRRIMKRLCFWKKDYVTQPSSTYFSHSQAMN